MSETKDAIPASAFGKLPYVFDNRGDRDDLCDGYGDIVAEMFLGCANVALEVLVGESVQSEVSKETVPRAIGGGRRRPGPAGRSIYA